MAKHHVARLQVNDHIAEAVSGRSKDWIKMKNPAAREMVVRCTRHFSPRLIPFSSQAMASPSMMQDRGRRRVTDSTINGKR
jgi:hypothetical protein